MRILLIAVCMFLTAGSAIRFVVELADYDGSAHSITELLLAGLEIVALGYLFSLL